MLPHPGQKALLHLVKKKQRLINTSPRNCSFFKPFISFMQMTLFSLLDAQTDVGMNFQGIDSLAIWIPHCLSVSVLNDYPVKYPILLNDFCFTSRAQDFCSILTVLKRNDNVVYSYQNKIILTKCF